MHLQITCSNRIILIITRLVCASSVSWSLCVSNSADLLDYPLPVRISDRKFVCMWMHCLQVVSDDCLEQLDTFYQLIAPSRDEGKDR